MKSTWIWRKHFEGLFGERYILKGQIAFEGHWRLQSWTLPRCCTRARLKQFEAAPEVLSFSRHVLNIIWISAEADNESISYAGINFEWRFHIPGNRMSLAIRSNLWLLVQLKAILQGHKQRHWNLKVPSANYLAKCTANDMALLKRILLLIILK
jgi:hypothetical protein